MSFPSGCGDLDAHKEHMTILHGPLRQDERERALLLLIRHGLLQIESEHPQRHQANDHRF
jgi:hypothetical protein